jgi:hypothetical protein
MKELADTLIVDLLSDSQSCGVPVNMFYEDLESQLASNCVPKVERLAGCEKADYGTRTHTVIIVDRYIMLLSYNRNDHVLFVEVEIFANKNAEFVLDENKLDFEFDIKQTP